MPEPRRRWPGQLSGPKQFRVPGRPTKYSRPPIDTSKPAAPQPLNVVPKPGPFRPDVKLDPSQIIDRRGDTPRPNRRRSSGGTIY